ncbi:maleylpyruvate isomerase family mycothiol-dependent enzyme [Phaeacidiphilus oryzae]|uniref:maleylpyruvate isomerase family mycothiol-dependent enzyme n=1 Tax=Phaeacidiphilus oryzae TaxID=348818 RepID=UPI000562EF2A|nr:maleylpyruvate isomerase family mycothiol-dependent enzyme [Phaeacidiphilus oryzae]
MADDVNALDYLKQHDELSRRFSDCLDGDLSVPVVHCGEWTLRDLAGHVGQGNAWVVGAIREHRKDRGGTPPPAEDAGVRAWFEGMVAELADALALDPETDVWTFWPPHTVGFWRRRRVHEMQVHVWDAEHAAGKEAPLDPAFAADGVAEVLDTMAPRQVKVERMAAPQRAVRLTASDTGGSWTWGPGEPVGEVTGTAERLLLQLWKRIPADDPSLSWSGDVEGTRAVLAGALAP